MKIITGSTGTAHITSNNDGEFNQGIFGEGLVVLSNGNKLAAQIKDSNTITIKDGDLIMQGRHALIEPNTTEDVTIETGSVGKKRIDLIVAKYQLNESTGYESVSLVVKKGTETTGNPQEPSYTTGNIRTGSLVAEMPLYKVNIDGITISSVVACFSAFNSIYSEITSIKSDLLDVEDDVESRGNYENIGSLSSTGTINYSSIYKELYMELVNADNRVCATKMMPYKLIYDRTSFEILFDGSRITQDSAGQHIYSCGALLTIKPTQITLQSAYSNGWTFNSVRIYGIK